MDHKSPPVAPLIRITLSLFLAVVSTGAIAAQSLRLADLDLTNATLHQAGPVSFYVRGVLVDDDNFSFAITQDDTGSWTITDIIPEASNILPPQTILDFATVSVEGSTIRIEGVLLGDSVYGGSLSVGEDANLELAEAIRFASNESVNTARSEALRSIIAAETEAAFRAQLEAERTEYETQLQDLREERDRLEEQLAGLPGGSLSTESESPLSGDQVDSLLRERDQLAGDIVGLVMENNELRANRSELREQIDELQKKNAELLEDIVSMTGEVDRLQELVAAYRSATGQADPSVMNRSPADTPSASPEEAVTAAPSWSFPGDYVRSADLQAAAEAVSVEIRALESRVAALEGAAGSLADLEEALRTGIREGIPATDLVGGDAGALPGVPAVVEPDARESASTPDAVPAPAQTTFGPLPRDEEAAPEPTDLPSEPVAEGAQPSDARATAGRAEAVAAVERAEQAARLAELRAQVADLLAQNELLRDEQRGLEQRILNEILSNGFVRMMEERLTRSIATGFSGATPDSGSWELSGGVAFQADEDAFFAKLAMPVEQERETVLYSFTVRTLDEGWVGAGLHLFVSDVERRRGYGMGSSLLVWFTRDPDVRRTTTTYLQLYKSDDDVNMERVLDAAIPEPLDETLRVDVLYEPQNQYITIAVNGVDRVRYRTWFGVETGVELAFRSLGRAEFQEFLVRTQPTEP